MWTWFIEWLRSWFWRSELEVTLLGLQNSGKTTLLKTMVAEEAITEETIPTVGFTMQRVVKRGATIKCSPSWDVGGQPRFRSLWERYCRGVNAILFVVDSSDASRFKDAHDELHTLVNLVSISSIPLLIISNKIDLDDSVGTDVVLASLKLEEIKGRECDILPVSAKQYQGVQEIFAWLMAHRGTQ